MKLTTMFKSLVVISAFGGFCSLGGYAAGKYGLFEPLYQTAKMKGKRINCQDLGLCNLETKEVYFRDNTTHPIQDVFGITDETLAKPVDLFDEKGKV